MKKQIFKVLALTAGIVLALSACSDDNNVEDPAQADAYNHVVSMITNEDGSIVYPQITEGQYVTGAETEKVANQYCEILTGLDCTGTSTTLDMGSYGTVKVLTSEEEGVFKTVSFNIADVKPFVLTIATEEYFKNDNSTITDFFKYKYRCNKCGKLTTEMFLSTEQMTHEIATGCDGTFVEIK